MLPLALEALMRQQGRNVPNEQDVGMLGMPTGMPFSNQAPYTPSRAPMDGSLGMLSALISGLSGHAGPEMQPEPDPRTMFIRPSMSPSMAKNGEAAYRHVGGMAEPGGEAAMLQELLHRGGANLDQSTVQGYQARAAKTGQGMGIVDPERNAAWKQGMADDEAARRGLVNQRAMQVAQARTNRQSGMDPRLAAILAAVGADSELGGVALGDAVGGRGAGLKMREQNMNAADNQRALDIQEGKNAATAPGAAAPTKEADAAGAITSGRLEDINKSNPPASSQEGAIRGEAAKIYDRHIKGGAKPRDAASYTARELMDKHGIDRPEAERIAGLFSGEAPIPREPMAPGSASPRGPISGTKPAYDDPFGALAEWWYRKQGFMHPKSK